MIWRARTAIAGVLS